MPRSFQLWSAAIFAPWLAWPRILAERRDSNWLLVAIAFESLLMRPEPAIRAVWSIFNRAAFMPVLRLGALQVVWALALSFALAFFLRLTRKGLAFGDLVSLTTWAYAPKLVVTLVFSALWLFGIDAFTSIAYYALSLVAVGVSVACLLRAYDSGAALPALPSPVPLYITVAVTLAIFGAAATSADQHRPIGRGDRVRQLTFAEQTITFPTDKPVLIDFWASWCGPCVDALPEWQALRSDSVTLISANVEPDNAEYVKKFLQENHYTFPVLTATNDLQSRFQVETLPSLVALSKDGEILAYEIGRTNPRHLLTTLQ